MIWKKITSLPWTEMLFLTLLSGFVYLPHAWELTYNKDDWYFMYDGLVRGADIFRDVALHTRPLRGFLYEFLYSLFGPFPLPYHLTSYLWRLLGGFGTLWLFNLLWPDQRGFNFSLAALFLLFPGFYWWVSGFELQPNIISLGLQAFSIVFTIKAVETDSSPKRIFYILASFLLGWAYLALVEYAIGMEGFRFLCIYILISRKYGDLHLVQTAWQTVRRYAIFIFIPIGFVIWYEFFFENWRKAQDAGVQLSALFTSPLTLPWLGVRLIQSTLNISILAWFVPFHENFISSRLRDILLGLILMGATITAFLIGNSLLEKRTHKESSPHETQSRFRSEAIWLGLLGTIAGVIPIVLANRSAVFSRVSQYTLPASLSGILLIGGIIYSLLPGKLKLITLSVLVGFAALSHHGLAARAVAEQQTIADFWWQVTWRAPSIRSDTLLVVRYPNINYADNDEMVWGPANFIYNPQLQQSGPVKVLIPAARMEQEAAANILMGSRDFDAVDLVIKYTSIHYNYRNILVITQPADQSCVHLMDQRWPDLTNHDEPLITVSASRSNTANVVVDAETPAPQAYIFGSEPLHEWCYFYQKADLARQQGEWDEIIILEQEAIKLGLHPNDQIEWMPFLQAHAFLGNEKKVRQISRLINTEVYYKQQACQNLGAMDDHGYPLSLEMQTYVDKIFCSADDK